MMKVASIVLLLCAVLAYAEPRVQPRRAVALNNGLVSPNHPYLFLTVPRGRSGAIVQGFEVVEQDDDEDDEPLNDDDDDEQMDDDQDEDDEEEEAMPQRFVVAAADDEDDEDDDMEEDVMPAAAKRPPMQLAMRNAKPTHMMVPRDQAGAIMVPDGVIEIEGQSVIDEKTGKAALLVPRAALDAIPDGSVVALMERSLDDAEEEARANRVVVRRRRKGSRRNVKRRGNRRTRGGRRGGRRRVNKRRNVRVVRAGGQRRRRGGRRGNRPMVIQG